MKKQTRTVENRLKKKTEATRKVTEEEKEERIRQEKTHTKKEKKI